MTIEIEGLDSGYILTMAGSDLKEVFITRAALLERVNELLWPSRVEREMAEASQRTEPTLDMQRIAETIGALNLQGAKTATAPEAK